MAGPTLFVLSPNPLNEETIARLRHELAHIADEVRGDDFWLQGRPFILSIGEECEGALEELLAGRLPDAVGWTPRDALTISAMCKSPQDHHLLAQVSLRIAILLNGLIGFGGQLFDEPCLDGEEPVPAVRVDNPEGMPGTVFATCLQTRNGAYGTLQFADTELLEFWLKHENFHLIK